MYINPSFCIALQLSAILVGYLQEKIGIKSGIYASGVSLIVCGILMAVIGIQRAAQQRLKDKEADGSS